MQLSILKGEKKALKLLVFILMLVVFCGVFSWWWCGIPNMGVA